jgi:hypothetical protein
MKYLLLFVLLSSPAYGAFELASPAMPTLLVGCDFDNALCRENPIMDDNERRLQEIERNQERLEQQQRAAEQERIERELWQSNSNQGR